MIRFAALLVPGPPTPETFEAYAAQVGPEEAATAQGLLSGQRPKRIAAPRVLLDWVAEATKTPPFLLDACLQVTPDKTEVAALLLPPASGTPPTLTKTLSLLCDRAAYLGLASTLPPQARLILNRLATGTFRTKLTPKPDTLQSPGTCLAILTLIDPSGPEATFALPHGNALVPLTRLKLTLPETPELLAWAKAHTTDRFGPLRQVTPTQVFKLAYDGTSPNPRRKSGLDLVSARLIAWHSDLTAEQATRLADLQQSPGPPFICS